MLNYGLRSPMTLWSIGITSSALLIIAVAGAMFGSPLQFLSHSPTCLVVLGNVPVDARDAVQLAPPFITKQEVDWANRNASILYTVLVAPKRRWLYRLS